MTHYASLFQDKKTVLLQKVKSYLEDCYWKVKKIDNEIS